MEFSWSAALEGLILGFSLIIPIGTQNAYILRQGTLGRHPYLAASVCGVCDSLLIIAGGLGIGSVISGNPLIRRLAVIGGVVFLVYYGLRSLRRAMKPLKTASSEEGGADSAGPMLVLVSAIAFSLLNPHAILDATVLIGGIAAQKEPWDLRLSFVCGTIVASWTWFYGLAYFATLLRPVFRKPIAARVLDGLVAFLMLGIAAMLAWAEISAK